MTTGERTLALDGLRGLAAATVMIAHFSNETGFLGRFLGLGAGQPGVMLFFCLSGYLMGSLYLRRAWSGRDVADFACRRFARIGPLFLLIVAASYLWARYAGFHWPLFDINDGNLISHLLFLQGVHVLWTVPVEVQFYALFPLLWLIFYRSRSVFIIVLVAMFFITEFVRFPDPPDLLVYGQFFVTGLGATLLPTHRSRIADVLFVLCLALYFVSSPRIITSFEVFPEAWISLPRAVLWHFPGYLLLMPIMVWSAANSSVAQIFLGNRPVAYFGNISYSTYLWHFPILSGLAAIPSLASNVPAFLPVFAAATVSAASLSYLFFEVPTRSAINGFDFPTLALRLMPWRES
jgi:peptidoglycan/LPS O-acetylase OafA/YrhL